jgi:two-component system nitrate/nitrite response regulator NarL
MPNAPKRNPALRVFVADASRMGCQLMAAALQRSCHRFTVTGYATDSIGVRTGLAENDVDIAVVGAQLKDGVMSGTKVTREIRASHPKLGVIVMLDSIERNMVVEAFRGGASGILSRDEPFEVLCKCIRAVYQGQIWASSNALRYVIDALGTTSPVSAINAKKGTSLLTAREQNVVYLVTEGLTNRDISRQLNLSENTVRNYLFRIFNKVGTSNRLELAMYAISHGAGAHPMNSTDRDSVPKMRASAAVT